VFELALSVVFAGSLLEPGAETAPPPADTHPSPPASQVVRATVVPDLVLRGDYEHPDAVLVGIAGSFATTATPLVTALARVGRVQVLVQRGAGLKRVRRWIATLPREVRDTIELIDREVDSPWVRDYGPLQLRRADGSSAWLDARYVERPSDDAIPSLLAERWGAPMVDAPWSLDGGALASNGEGLCVSTIEYFEAHKVPAVGSAARAELLPAVGCRVLALVPALPEEPTHHADLFVQFLGPRTVAVASLDPALDPGVSARLDEAARGIVRAAAAIGLRITVVRAPIGIDIDGEYHPYLNGLRLRDAFLMPVYHRRPSATEMRARAVLEAAMPGVEVLRIPAWEMADLGGAVHCVALGLFTPRASASEDPLHPRTDP
jgi:agmatine deiminase